MRNRAIAAALLALCLAHPARAESDADRVEQLWANGHVIPPGRYVLDRPVTFDVTGIRILTLDGVVFDGTRIPAGVPFITRFCSAEHLHRILGAVWIRGNHRVAAEINQNSCLSLRRRDRMNGR